MFGIDLHDYFNVTWEQARGALRDELDSLKAELRGRWNAALGPDNQLNVLSIGGNGTPATRYVSNTGTNNAPTWDQVNLANGVKGRLPLTNFALANPGVVLGRGTDVAGGDFVQMTLGDDILAPVSTLNVSERVAAAASLSLWASEGGI